MYAREICVSSREAFLAIRALGEDFGQRAFAHAQRAFNDDEAGSLRSAGGDRGAFGGGGFVGRHSVMAILAGAGLLTGVGCRFERPLQLAGSMRGIIAESAK